MHVLLHCRVDRPAESFERFAEIGRHQVAPVRLEHVGKQQLVLPDQVVFKRSAKFSIVIFCRVEDGNDVGV
jgi:hypothetical protein